jgi:hypothetical protein
MFKLGLVEPAHYCALRLPRCLFGWYPHALGRMKNIECIRGLPLRAASIKTVKWQNTQGILYIVLFFEWIRIYIYNSIRSHCI